MIPVFCFKCLGKEQCEKCKNFSENKENNRDIRCELKPINDPVNFLVINGDK